jgi:uncharacterized protein (DUF2252 family)
MLGVKAGANGASSSTQAHDEGRALRREKPPTWIADWRRPDGVDPVAILRRVAEGRDPRLVKLRNKEMADSAFSFLRGAAAVMSADLAASLKQLSGIELDICGDAHLANFGAYYSPERALVFDVNDFDEARLGPWEWDICRLAASVAVAAGEYLSVSKEDLGDLVESAARAYADQLHSLAGLPLIERCYTITRIAAAPDRPPGNTQVRIRKDVQSLFGDVSFQTQRDAVDHFIADGGRGQSFAAGEVTQVSGHVADRVIAAYGTYRTTLEPGMERLLDGYSPSCAALRPVGEGSLGLHDYLIKVTGHTPDDGLILQVKEATPSALDGALGHRAAVHEGERVVGMQRMLQAVSDPLLGWTSIDGQAYYVRQFRDGKGAPNLEKLRHAEFGTYAALCGKTLAAAHARSANPVSGGVGAIAGYIGTGREQREFTQAVATFARRYARVTREDAKALERSGTRRSPAR